MRHNTIEKENTITKQWRCTVCDYISEGQDPPEACPQCKAPASRFEEVKEDGNMVQAAEHRVSIARDIDEEIKAGLHANFKGRRSEVGMYLTVSRVVFREGYPEISEYWRRAALKEVNHTSRLVEMLGEIATSPTKKNLEMRAAAESGAAQGKVDLTMLAKKQNLDAIHDSIHGMTRDEARHGRAFQGLLERYSGEGE